MNIRKVALSLFAAALALPFFVGVAHADRAQMQQLVPDVPYVRKTSRTLLFSRAQFKYGLERDDYLNRWVDQPLFVDPDLRGDVTERQSIYYPSFRRIQEVVKQYGLDGLGLFPQTSGRAQAYELAKRSGLEGFHLLTELIQGDTNPSRADVLKMALDNPASQRVDGKVLLLSYRADSKTPEYWAKELATLKKQYGDTFIALPALIYFAGESPAYWQKKYENNTVTPEDITKIKDSLRAWAKATDGLYFSYVSGVRKDDRTLDEDFYRNFVIRLYKSVLAEPGFEHKYFGLAAMVGHENATRVGYTFSSDGTQTLRGSLDAALDAHADVIDIAEWDEQNENTSLRPTVYNGTSSMRILRYYSAKQKGQKLSPLPGDDTSIPNLIVSYRKVLVLGEKLEIELLNVPDSGESTSYTVRVVLEDAQGKTVYTSPVQQMKGDQLQSKRLTIPSETFSADAVLRPKLEIEYDGRKSTYKGGLHYIALRSTWNWDYKWVKQPLRDLLKPTTVNFEVGDPDADGKRIVTAEFAANEPLAYVEVLDNDNIVYIQPPAADPQGNEWRENKDQVVISIDWQSRHSLSKALILKGDITLENATGKWLLPGDNNTTARNPFIGQDLSPALNKQKVSIDGMKSSNWQGRIFVAIPRSQLQKAVLDIIMPGLYTGKLPVQQLMKNSIFGIPGTFGFNMVISRYLRQDKMPRHLKADSTKFSVAVMPDLPTSVLHLQAIGESGHLYRSKPIVLNSPAASYQEKIAVYSDTQKHPVELEVKQDRVPDINYQFNPKRGSVLVADAGRPFWGILGGYFTEATERGGGESNDGTPFLRANDYPTGVTKGAPDWVKTETGEDALRFDGKGTYITLPQGVIPRRAGFTIDMDIKLDEDTGKQFLIGNRTYYMGSLVVFIDNGELTAEYLGDFSGTTKVRSGVKVPAGKWSHLTIRYDQKNLVFEVDGQKSKPLKIEGPGLYDTLSVVGGYGKDWFKGEIKSLRIRHLPTIAKNE